MSNKTTEKVTTVGEVKALVKAFLDAKVLDPNMLFAMIVAYGQYPVVLLNKDIRKHVDKLAKLAKMTKDQADSFHKNLLVYNVEWLMKQDDNIPLCDEDGTSVGTPVAQVLNKSYKSDDASREDLDSMRIDIIAPISAGDKIMLEHWPNIDGWVIVSMTKRQVYAIFGNTSKMLKLNDLEEETQDEKSKSSS